MSNPAFIYARYSSLEQGKGSSLKRQFDACREHIAANGWEYPDFKIGSPERDFFDEGKSAYSGANRAPGGQLYAFEQKALAGHFRNGAVLVVENLDRLTRQGWTEALKILENLTLNGVTVATVHGRKLWRSGERPDMGQVITVIVEAEADHRASDDKSKRLRKAWSEKIEAIQNGDKRAISKVTPAWIVVDEKTRLMSAHPHRAKVLKEIYDLYEAGYGLPKIVSMLNGRKEASWAYGKKDTGQGWNTAYLHKLLTNRAVMGEYEPMSRTHGGINETSKGIRVLDYYPRVIEADQFNRITAIRAGKRRTGGRTTYRLFNLFAGMMFCTHCGAAMYYQSQQRAGRKTNHKLKDGSPSTYIAGIDRSYMVCNNSRRGHKCENTARFRYEFLEASVLDTLLTLAMDDGSFVMPDQIASMMASVAEAERQIDGKRRHLENLGFALQERFSKTVANQAGDLEDEIEAAEKELALLREALEREKGQASPEEHLQRVREVRASISVEEPEARYEARQRVKQALIRIARINCTSDGIATVQLVNELMVWRFDQQGQQIGEPLDLRNRLDLHKGIASGLGDNAAQVREVLGRSKGTSTPQAVVDPSEQRWKYGT